MGIFDAIGIDAGIVLIIVILIQLVLIFFLVKQSMKLADKEEQMDTKTLVDLLQKDAEIMRPEEVEQLSRHFRSKIAESRKEADETANMQSFHAIMREVLDRIDGFLKIEGMNRHLQCTKHGDAFFVPFFQGTADHRT